MSIIRHEPIRYERDTKISFDSLDNIPYYNENDDILDHKVTERDEQLIARDHVIPSDVVLELGGRYGTVSCIINNILDDPSKHIVIEPDARVIPALLKNRDRHNSMFTVYQNIISNTPSQLIYADYATRVVCCHDDSSNEAIPSIKLCDITHHHNISSFTALVADCEGCLERFIDDHMHILPSLRMITYEQDFGETCDYKKIENILKNHKFVCVKDGFHMVWKKQQPEPNVAMRGPKATIFASYFNKYM